MSKKYGIIGRHLSHSMSPELHAIYGSYSGGYSYEKFDVEEDGIEAVLRNTEYSGFNVTSPHKRAVIRYMDELTPEAKRLQAVNTIERTEDGRLIGHNTDVYGFRKMAGGKRIHGRKVLVFGTGGASSAICEALRQLNAKEIWVVSRTAMDAPRHITYDDLKDHLDAEVLVNATPIGMYPNNGASPLDPYDIRMEDFTKLESAFDAIYNPYRTKFLFDAADAGAFTKSGLAMLVYQGLRAAEIWGTVPEGGYVTRRVRRRGRRHNRSTRRIDLGRVALRRLLWEQLNIVVIGMPGSGKSSITRQVALLMGKPFVDTDREITKQEGRAPGEIISQDGEDVFRPIETEILKKICREKGQVVASGGGAIVRLENHRILRENSMVIYLKRPIKFLAMKNRPLSQSLGVEELYRQRGWKYEAAADLIIENNNWFGDKNDKRRGNNKYMKDIRQFAETMRRKIERYLNENTRN